MIVGHRRYVCSKSMNIALQNKYIYTRQCTYLNISLLEAPREYILHGPLLALYWAWLCPHSGSHACPEDADYSLNDSGLSFTQRPFAFWVASHQCTSEHHVIIHGTQHTFIIIHGAQHTFFYTSHSHVTSILSSLHIFCPPWQAGYPWLLMSGTRMYLIPSATFPECIGCI
jgi:hypothetical protein